MLKLDLEQQEAVEYGQGPLLIEGGPGSGKTLVIAQRLVYLLTNVAKAKPESVLTLTFTEKAAIQIREVVGRVTPAPSAISQITTFHGFSYSVLHENGFTRKLLDRVGLWILLRRNFEELEIEQYQALGQVGPLLDSLCEFFSRCAEELVEPEDYESYAQEVEEAFLKRALILTQTERRRRKQRFSRKKFISFLRRSTLFQVF